MPIISLPVDRIGMVARWKPVHNGHATVLRALKRSCEQLIIGLGSSNIYDARSPFTAAESAAMISCVLGPPNDTYQTLEIPDLFDGPRWRAMVIEKMGPLDIFVTANRYVRDLLKEDYLVIHPVQFLQEHERTPLTGSQVRHAAARGEDWRVLVPEPVAEYIKENRLMERMIREFGSAVLSPETSKERP